MEDIHRNLPLSRLLDLSADAVQAVREGRSLTDVLARCPADARPGVQALSFHTLRWLGSAGALRALLAPKTPPPRVDALLCTALALLWPEGKPPYAEHTLVDQAVAAARQRTPAAAAFVNAVLRRFLREREALVSAARRTPLGAYNHPAWWVERVRADWPEHWQAVLLAANQHPPMTLRVNARRGTGLAYLQRLAAAGRSATLLEEPVTAGGALAGSPARPAALANETSRPAAALVNETSRPAAALATEASRPSATLVLAQPCPVEQLPGFAEGEVSVQDAAAQRAAPLLLGRGAGALPAGARVLDACAAPGGKTAHLLELADLDVLALDSDPLRLARVQGTLNRLGLRAELKAGDARDPARWWDGRPFDAVLLDAPCSASGIVRRHPDVRWLRRPDDIAALARLQAELLAALWPLLAPGGRLLYATCSLFKAEGQEPVSAFLQRHGPAEARLDPGSPGHLLPLADNPDQAGAGRVAPNDGFYYALIHKH